MRNNKLFIPFLIVVVFTIVSCESQSDLVSPTPQNQPKTSSEPSIGLSPSAARFIGQGRYRVVFSRWQISNDVVGGRNQLTAVITGQVQIRVNGVYQNYISSDAVPFTFTGTGINQSGNIFTASQGKFTFKRVIRTNAAGFYNLTITLENRRFRSGFWNGFLD